MKITSVKGTNDYLPNEVEIRDYLQNKILDVYVSNGFEHITTPIIEDIENLDKSDGGENLNLIFKILKRGDKLDKALAKGVTSENENELADMGLRYDLTLPLSRYIANNKDKLTFPMKCIQMDRVYRAERPQKGRLREFVQCDIDIIGSDSTDSEIELILTTTKALDAIGMKNYKVKINDRRLLRAVLISFGFKEEELDSVCITFDKMDKVGLDGVKEELEGKEFDKQAIDNFVQFLSKAGTAQNIKLDSVKDMLEDKTPAESIENIINTVNKLTGGRYEVVFDLSLVRGQGYYTGTVFEVESIDFKGAIAGGGRYDNLIGKFLGQQISAVGFSIGFERIFSILMEHGVTTDNNNKKLAIMYEEGNVEAAYSRAEELRKEGFACALYVKPKKMGKFLSKLEERGFAGFVNVEQGAEVSMF
ncbi:MAG: histidine--tRNA ligase [Lachnospira sp.]|nr:histidine--tRNA ligase [Lachnospira sp.]MDD5829211.1 histidine--tRNA ligase [Lachnospira sp.]